ncbi:MAG: hypothetical protein FJ088_10240, partial [Deltaproteobacteria bacterium]|nr:hypothetical protein [Deltaproteobacteria bacterium]
MQKTFLFSFFLTATLLFCSKGGKVEDALDLETPDVAEAVETVSEIVPGDVFESQDISGEEVSDGLPQSLPFELKRADEGEPLTEEEIGEFTAKMTGLWKQIDFFRWVLRTSHGMDASTGKPDYMVWWHDVDAVKEGDKVTFRHSQSGGAHNIYIPTSKVLAQAIGGYLLTGDAAMGKVAEQYAKGITASMKGMVYDDKDPLEYLMSRNIVAQNHEYEIDGRKKAVDYTPWYNAYEEWNAHRIHYPNNPYWGDIWVTNMRSKDDVCHIFRTAPFLLYAAEYGKDEYVRVASKEAYEYLQGFSKDIVDSGYYIRTKDKDGKPYIPSEDLASFVSYDELFPLGECTPKLSSALLGYGEAKGIDCGKGYDKIYEGFATTSHYYNYAILRNFHMAAVINALVAGKNDAAFSLLLG